MYYARYLFCLFPLTALTPEWTDIYELKTKKTISSVFSLVKSSLRLNDWTTIWSKKKCTGFY